jgi:hypothetical protein
MSLARACFCFAGVWLLAGPGAARAQDVASIQTACGLQPVASTPLADFVAGEGEDPARSHAKAIMTMIDYFVAEFNVLREFRESPVRVDVVEGWDNAGSEWDGATGKGRIILGWGLVSQLYNFGHGMYPQNASTLARLGGTVAVLCLVAHELAHQYQFRVIADERYRTETKNMELEADALASAILVAMGYADQLSLCRRVFYMIGGVEFARPDHHGFPNERQRYSEWGQGYALDRTVNAGDLHRSLYGKDAGWRVAGGLPVDAKSLAQKVSGAVQAVRAAETRQARVDALQRADSLFGLLLGTNEHSSEIVKAAIRRGLWTREDAAVYRSAQRLQIELHETEAQGPQAKATSDLIELINDPMPVFHGKHDELIRLKMGARRILAVAPAGLWSTERGASTYTLELTFNSVGANNRTFQCQKDGCGCGQDPEGNVWQADIVVDAGHGSAALRFSGEGATALAPTRTLSIPGCSGSEAVIYLRSARQFDRQTDHEAREASEIDIGGVSWRMIRERVRGR